MIDCLSWESNPETFTTVNAAKETIVGTQVE